MEEIATQTINATAVIISHLDAVNSNLSSIASTISKKSFFDSQAFGAIVGASSALFIFFLEKIISFCRKRITQNRKLYFELAEHGDIFSPRNLRERGGMTMYGHTKKDREGTTVVPEKPLGEKMLIQLRRVVKYWDYRNYWLRRMFKKYSKIIKSFDETSDRDSDEGKKNMKRAELMHTKIMRYVYRKTGEDEWSIR